MTEIEYSIRAARICRREIIRNDTIRNIKQVKEHSFGNDEEEKISMIQASQKNRNTDS